MTTKTISTYIAAGYTLASKYSQLDITSGGGIGGTGLTLTADATVVSGGRINATSGSANGITAEAGADISSNGPGASISGYSGIFAPNAPITIASDGDIVGTGRFGDGAFLVAGGEISNGLNGRSDYGFIRGKNSGVAAGGVTNIFSNGTIIGTYGQGVYLKSGGFVSNGEIGVTASLIEGIDGQGLYAKTAAATVFNFATIASLASDGIALGAGGAVTNGASSDAAASIHGVTTGVSAGALATITNFGSISETASGGAAVSLAAGGRVFNEQSGTIGGATGVSLTGVAGTVENYGKITASGAAAISLAAGGLVENFLGGSIAGVSGVYLAGVAGTVENYGKIIAGASAGVLSISGGKVLNGQSGSISGAFGVFVNGAYATVDNYGTITASVHGAVDLLAGGKIVNGSATDISASIAGHNGGAYVNGAAGTVTNFGSIASTASNGVSLDAGGTVANGTRTDTSASIRGMLDGVYAKALATVGNFGTIEGLYADGAHLNGGGVLTNGSILDTQALVEGYSGVFAQGASATVANFGMIEGVARYGDGVFVVAGGTITNGAANDTAALIEGANSGVSVGATATVKNFGSIFAGYCDGIYAQMGASVTNGSATDAAASIEGVNGVVAKSGPCAIANFGDIVGVGTNHGAVGVELGAGGSLANGAPTRVRATVEGYTGVQVLGAAGTVANYGTLQGDGVAAVEAGVYLGGGGVVTNGASGDRSALIEGASGVIVTGGGTVINFASIVGAVGTAVAFGSSTDTLVVETGCAFVGRVLGGGGTLDLDSGTGIFTANLASGSVTISGSMAATMFQTFDTVEIGAAATFVSSGTVSIASGQTILDAGTLTLGASKAAVSSDGTIEALGGTLTVKGAVTGKGQAIVNGGTLDFTASFNQNVTFVGTAGTLELAQSQSYGATIAGFSKSGGTFLDLADIGFTGSGEATYAGNKKGGVLTVTDGTHTAHINLKGNYLNSTFVAASDGHGGTIVHDPAAKLPALQLPHAFIAAMAGLGGGGAGLEIAAAWRLHTPPMLLAPRTQIA